MSEPEVRALRPTDAGAAHALVLEFQRDTRYLARFLELVDGASDGMGEDQGMVVADDAQGTLLGIALHGTVAGAQRVARVHLLAAHERATLDLLARTLVGSLSGRRVRLIVAEIPDEPRFAEMSSALLGVGFVERGRVPDWFRDGIPLAILVARL